jgi:hypothetical protein
MNYINSWDFVNAVESVVRRFGGGSFVPLTTYNAYVLSNNTALSDVSGVAHQALSLATSTALSLPISGYADISGSLTIATGWTEMVSLTLTTTIPNTPIMIWGNLYSEDTQNGSTIQVRIHINTPVSQYSPIVSSDIQSKHATTDPIFYRGIGPSTPGPVLIQVDARTTKGSASRQIAQLMVLANPLNG